MKTEKRLTMALSVLVALMMLAVPLASSSNLFVDGGQTNSNGDAPNLGAAPGEGYTITFKLNSDGKSLDAVDLTNIPASGSGITWYQNENGDLCALVTDNDLTIQKLINALYSADGSASLITKGHYGEAEAKTYAYKLTSWKDANSGVMYLYKTISESNKDNSPNIDKDMIFDAQWLLDEKTCVEIPVKVTFDGETKEYVKAYPYKANTENTQVDVDPAFFKNAETEKIMDVTTTGQSVNPNYATNEAVYTFKMTDSYETAFGDVAVPIKVSNNTIIIEYTLKSTYSKVIVSSVMFEEDVVMYTKNNTPFTYKDVYEALKNVVDSSGNKIFKPSTEGISTIDGSVLVNDGSYKVTSWNDNVPLDSAVYATSPLTLNATLNSYKVVFMVNGDYEIVTVNYGELSADKCPLDVTGLSGWFIPKDDNYTAFDNFYFTEANVADLETKVTDSKGAYVPVFIAAFTAEPKFAVFNAVKTNDGNFGDKAVTNVVIPVKADSTIPEPAASPVYKEKTLFLGWTGYDASKKTSEYTAVDGVITFKADVTTYKYTITFYNGSDVVGTFYYDNDLNGSAADMKSGLKAFTYKGVSYKLGDLTAPTEPAANADADVKAKYEADKDRYDAATKAYNSILYTAKAGYEISQWKDADGNLMLDKVDKDDKTYEVKFDKIKADASFYAAFDAEDYLIAYNGNTATATNNMPQIGTVDSAVNLFSDAAFSNDGYKLKEWNTRPDGKGTSYALGASFTLTGEQYEDLKGVPTGDGLPSDGSYEKGFTLYAIWEKVGGSGSGSGDNNEGNDGNNTDTYLLAGILAVIIILIILIAFLMRRKN